MKRSFIQRWLKDILISRKLYFTVGIISVLILFELFTLIFAIRNLSAVRAYVNGEGLWSKHQKDAVFYLREYSYTRNERDYWIFKHKMKVPLGDKIARTELEKDDPDLEVARQGFIQGRNNPEDVDGLINLFIQFRHIYYIDKAIGIWTQTDPYLDTLLTIGNEMHYAIYTQKAGEDEVLALLHKLEPVNAKITRLEDEFSYTLGEGSRWIESLVMILLIALTFTVEIVGILITVYVGRGIETGLKELIRGTKRVTGGALDTQVKVDSKDEIGQLARQFNLMTSTIRQKIEELKRAEENIRKEKERAEASEKVKQMFLANMSHEIRTPMNGILGFARLLEDSKLNKEQAEYIRAIVQSGDNLLVILNDILDFSKIEAGKIAFEETPFSLSELVEAAITMVRPKADEKSISLSYHQKEMIPDKLSGDPVRLSQILLNLLSNAIKFTESGSVTVSTYLVQTNENLVTIGFSVRDTGIGIATDVQARIFDSFEQATLSTSRKFGGTGLGLSIVKQLVELQGGRIWLTSKPGEGSDFCVSLPFRIARDYVQPEVITFREAKPVEKPKGIHILVAEDNTVNQLLVSRVLEKQGFTVELAGNGIEALQKLESGIYDIILMDLQMPEMDGYETTVHIRNLPNAYNAIPIVAMTAHTIKGEVEKCLALGMTDFISKPFDAEELKGKILKLVTAKN